jgi:hypothetical protein
MMLVAVHGYIVSSCRQSVYTMSAVRIIRLYRGHYLTTHIFHSLRFSHGYLQNKHHTPQLMTSKQKPKTTMARGNRPFFLRAFTPFGFSLEPKVKSPRRSKTPRSPKSKAPEPTARKLKIPKHKLQDQLDGAIPAEQPWDPSVYEDEAGLCIRLFGDPKDGLWLCCKGHENKLVHYQGKHPFKVLTCGNENCSHTLCDECRQTEILTPARSLVKELFEQQRPRSAATNEVPYCYVCRSCGLSQRAKYWGSLISPVQPVCACGHKIPSDDFPYFIGSVHGYRYDSQNCIMELRMQRLKVVSDRLEAGRSYFS